MTAHIAPAGTRIHGPVVGAGVDAELIRLFLPYLVERGLLFRTPVGEHVLYAQTAAGYFQIGETHPLGIPGNFEDLGPKLLWVDRRSGVPGNSLEKLRHPLQLQRRAKPAGEYLSVSDEGDDIGILQMSMLQILFQNSLVAQGGILPPRFLRNGEVHAAAAEPLLKLPQQGGMVGPCQIHLVDKQKGGNMIPGEQLPQGEGMPLHSIGAADD